MSNLIEENTIFTDNGSGGGITSVNGDTGPAVVLSIPSVSGTTNYLSKFTGSTSLGNSQVFDNGTNVGIGTNTPSGILTLADYFNFNIDPGSNKQFFVGDSTKDTSILIGYDWNQNPSSNNPIRGYRNINDSCFIEMQNVNSGTGALAGFTTTSDVAEGGLLAFSSTNTVLPIFQNKVVVGAFNTDLAVAASNNIIFAPGFSIAGAWTSAGNFGIGTTAPSQRLHVEGKGLFRNGFGTDYGALVYSNGTDGGMYIGHYTGSASNGAGLILSAASGGVFSDGSARIDVPATSGAIWVYGSTGNVTIGNNLGDVGSKLYIKSASGTAFRVDGSLLSNLFYVTNSGTVSSYSGYWIDGTKFLSTDQATKQSVLLGNGAGANLSLATVVAIGYHAYNSQTNNSAQSVAIGHYALELENGGTGNNTAIGFACAGQTANATEITAVGAYALYNSTGGQRQTAIGTEALRYSNGQFNVGLGRRAGNTITSGEFNTFLGSNSDADDNNRSQSIAIGYNSIITANNQLIIGSAAAPINDAYIGTSVSTPNANLYIGTVKIYSSGGYKSSDGSTGATGTFTSADAKTITVKDGIITSIV